MEVPRIEHRAVDHVKTVTCPACSEDAVANRGNGGPLCALFAQ